MLELPDFNHTKVNLQSWEIIKTKFSTKYFNVYQSYSAVNAANLIISNIILILVTAE